ncbi:hypothetical protein TIFTF001_027753 [Ficus carica]|uniref:Uncharacterized protein n=1 Tax=Ficus carica TaxID=3494 RepID=A0AA88DNK8_FICCA|nr:hypothetical protein TIFTF001_027753 [Ficus carica]
MICGLEFRPTNHAIKPETRCGKLAGGSLVAWAGGNCAWAWLRTQPGSHAGLRSRGLVGVWDCWPEKCKWAGFTRAGFTPKKHEWAGFTRVDAHVEEELGPCVWAATCG